MRVAIAGFELESVSFLSSPTTLADFQRHESRGENIVTSHRGTNKVIGGFVKVCEVEGVEMIGIVSSGAGAAAATDEAFDHYCRAICEGIAKIKDRIEGEVPSAVNPPGGCAFHPRCSHAVARRASEQPALVEAERSRMTACHMPWRT